jgi:hypothetical protein
LGSATAETSATVRFAQPVSDCHVGFASYLLQPAPARVGRDEGLRGRHGRLGLRGLGGEVAVIHDEQHLTRGNLLVLPDLHFLDVALDLRADHRRVALDIGVVGRLHEAPFGPPTPPGAGAERQRDGQEQK